MGCPCINASGKSTVAVRILRAINSRQIPKAPEVALLRAYCGDQETPVSDLAFHVARELYEQLKNSPLSRNIAPSESPALNPLGGPNDPVRTRARLGSAQDGR